MSFARSVVTPVADARWVLPETAEEAAAALRATLDCPRPIARLLAARHITDAASFFNPTLADLHAPDLLLGMDVAVQRIQRAVALGEPILIYGDYDVDGTTATVLLKTAIERIAAPGLPANVTYHVPHRLREGYGIHGVRLAEAAAAGIKLVLSVDTGIRAFAAAAEARALGLDLIVTDHHLPDGAEGVPEAVAVINPAQAGCPYPNKHLCGAGVAFKLAHALLAAHASDDAQRRRLETAILPSFLKLVAIATIADSVELTGENRAIVWLGLRELRNPVQPGLRALMQVAKLELDRPPTAQEVGFRIAPRINAAGRMDIASDVVELFLTRDAERARSLAEKLDALNQDRRDTEAAALEAIDRQLLALRTAAGYPRECIVLDDPAWHRGVIGILASRVVDRTGRPALVIASEDGDAFGSGRSIDGYHLVDALSASHTASSEPLFTRFGGHAHAVGFSLPTQSLGLLRERMRAHSAASLSDDMLTPSLRCDVEVAFAELDFDLLRWLERCAPFGMGHPEPVFLTRGLRLAAPPRIVKDKHVCLQLCAQANAAALNAMGWTRTGHTSWAERIAANNLQAGSVIDLMFRFRENRHPTYGGLELDMIDFVAGEGRPASIR
jgi:single-stranded-DNA-specific exonuclease